MLKRNHLAACFFILVMMMSKTDPVRAQEGPDDISIPISISQRYDDNVTFSNTDPRSDLITSLKAGAAWKHTGPRLNVKVSGNVTQDLFWDETDDSNTSELVDLMMDYELSKLERVQASNAFSHAFDPRSFEEEAQRVGGRFGFYRNSFDLTYSKLVAKDLTVSAGYGNDLDIATRDTLIDSYVNRFRLQGAYALSSQSTVLGAYDLFHRRLEPGGEALINTLSAGLRQSLTEQLSLEVRAGVDLIDSYNGEDLVKPLWQATLADQLDERTTVHLTMQERHSTNPFTSDVFDSWSIAGGIERQLLRDLDGSASLYYSKGEFDTLAIEEDFVGFKAGLVYAITEDWKGSVEYNFSEKTATQASREYEKNTFTVSIKRVF